MVCAEFSFAAARCSIGLPGGGTRVAVPYGERSRKYAFAFVGERGNCHTPSASEVLVVRASQFTRLVEDSNTHGWPACACAEMVSAPPPPWVGKNFGWGKFVNTAVTVAFVAGMMNGVTAAFAFATPPPVQWENAVPPGGLPAVSVSREPAPKFPPPVPLTTVSA